MICSICRETVDALGKPGQFLARKCTRHYLEIKDVVLVLHRKSSANPFLVERANVTAVHGQTFSYALVHEVSDPHHTGTLYYSDEGMWWSRTVDDESAGALRATNALAAP